MKDKSERPKNPRRTVEIFRTPPKSSSSATTVASSDEESHLKELQSEWKKPASSRNKSHIKMLLQHTTKLLEQKLKDSPSGGVSTVLQDFPCFEDGNYVSIIIS